MPNDAAQAHGNPAYCGDRETSIVLSNGQAEVEETCGQDCFYFIVKEANVATVPEATTTLMLSIYLTDYPTVNTEIDVVVTYICPASVTTTWISQEDYSSGMLYYDLSQASGPLSITASESQIEPPTCQTLTGTTVLRTDLGQGNEVEDEDFHYDASANTIQLSVGDPSSYTSQEVRSFQTYKLFTRWNGEQFRHACDSFQITYVHPDDVCPTTTVEPTDGSTSMITIIYGSSYQTSQPIDREDDWGILTGIFYFCGPRTYNFIE